MEEKKINYSEKNIFQKMLLATEKISRVAKNLNVGNGQNQYKAVSEVDVLNAVKPIEIECGIYSYPVSREIIDTNILTSTTEFDGKTKEKKQLFMRLEVKYRFVNTDKPDEFIDITTYGDGVDTQDKAPGKAMTYADKYALLKAYKIETGDDPDKEPSADLKSVSKKEVKATTRQIEYLKKYYVGDLMTKLLQANNLERIEDISVKKASDLIKLIKEKEESK